MPLCNRRSPSQKTTNQSKCIVVGPSLNEYMPPNSSWTWWPGITAEEEMERLFEPEDQGNRCLIMSPRNMRSYTRGISPAWLCKDQLNCEDSNTKMDGIGEPARPQSHTENYRQQGNAESGKNSLSQRREHQLVIQCQIAFKIWIKVTLYRLSRLYLYI